MNQDEIDKLEIISIDLNTDLCILKNAMKNDNDNDLLIDDLVDFIEKIYKLSKEMRDVFVNSLG